MKKPGPLFTLNLGRKPTRKERAWMESVSKFVSDEIQIDTDQLLRNSARAFGMPMRMLRTVPEVTAFRKRSAAAKKGWANRRKKR